MAQSADNTGAAALAASARFDFSLATAQLITPANAPNGFVYASIMVAATQIPTAASMSIPTAIGYQWFSTGRSGSR
jgi:N-methylhydantoinase B/oxoprolinase/acetone carboxylase alpha subunit